MSTTSAWQHGIPGSPGATWAAAGPNGGDVAYRTQTLKFTPVELALAESVSLRTLFMLWMKAVFISFLVFMLFFFLWMMVVVLDSPDGGSSFHLGILSTGSLIAFVVFWVALLLSVIEDPISEWKALLEDKAAAADSAYAAIYGSLRRRWIPVGAVAMRIRSDVLSTEVVNNRLVISDRSYAAYVSVFPYGTSLYVGWTLWRSRRGAVIIGTYFKDLIGGFVGRSGLINQMLRTEKVRAMREAVHSATREGVEVAVAGVEVPIVATFGQDIPVQTLIGTGAGAGSGTGGGMAGGFGSGTGGGGAFGGGGGFSGGGGFGGTVPASGLGPVAPAPGQTHGDQTVAAPRQPTPPFTDPGSAPPPPPEQG